MTDAAKKKRDELAREYNATKFGSKIDYKQGYSAGYETRSAEAQGLVDVAEAISVWDYPAKLKGDPIGQTVWASELTRKALDAYNKKGAPGNE